MAVPTVTVPLPLFCLAIAYTVVTALIGLVVSVLLAPALILSRRRADYFKDYNATALAAPWLFWHIGGAWHRVCELLGNYFLPAPQRVCDMASAYMRSAALITLSELGVPDELERGPQTGAALAAALGCHRDYLERVLRLCARLQLVAVSAPDPADPEARTYALTQLSAVLCESHVNSVKHMVGLFGDHFPAFAHLTEGVRSGATPYRLYAKGLSHWEHMTAQPELYTRFNKAMADFNRLCPIEAVFLAFDLAPFRGLVDVGGGLGAFSAAALAAQPQLAGHLFDLRHVIKQAQQTWAEQWPGLAPRMAFTAGSFFEPGSLPRPAPGVPTLYALRQILHDWSDADCLRILREVRAAIGDAPGCRLVIVESCIAAGRMTTTHTPRVTGDVHMMVQYGDARERTDAQFAALLHAAGFRLARLLPTKSLFFVLEAAPV